MIVKCTGNKGIHLSKYALEKSGDGLTTNYRLKRVAIFNE